MRAFEPPDRRPALRGMALFPLSLSPLSLFVSYTLYDHRESEAKEKHPDPSLL